MKTKLTLLVAALAFIGVSYAGPSDSAAFAIRHARESAARNQGQSVVVANVNSSASYVPSSSGKGVVQTSTGDDQVTSIALFKSSKKAPATVGSACCAKKH